MEPEGSSKRLDRLATLATGSYVFWRRRSRHWNPALWDGDHLWYKFEFFGDYFELTFCTDMGGECKSPCRRF
jgi:hypothetical protein